MEADLMRWERAVSMRLTKRDGGRRVNVIRIIGGEEVGSAREGVGSSKRFSGDVDHF